MTSTDSFGARHARCLRAAGPAVLLLLASCAAPAPAATSSSAPPPVSAAAAPPPSATSAQGVVVDAIPGHVKNSFRPLRALGASIDRLSAGSFEALYSPSVVKDALSSGWGALTYRLNTELHVEDWHWNPQGTWSDPAGRGYFIGSAAPTSEPIRKSFGYPLPSRGITHNEGTETEGYSRLTDGDHASFWKSNPYLAPAFTGESDSAFPQWVVLDLGTAQEIDAIRIEWGAPYAKSYSIAYFEGADPLRKPADGRWVPFAGGAIETGAGGVVTHRLAKSATRARFVRISMTESSNTCNPHDPKGKSDRRNCVGYAIREIELGALAPDGTLHDLVRHAPSQSQTATDCSSVDPWHEPKDIEARGVQTGLDLFFTSGLTRGLPAMIPVAVVYGTPENAAAEIAYVEKRGYPISYVELGEEADGQYMTPEHYAALYVRWAKAIHDVDPKLALGGPAFTGQNEDIKAWPDARGNVSWFGRFLDYLKAHGRMSDLAFMSFEHYPFDPCKAVWDSLYDEPRLISHILQVWRDDGLPPEVPMLVTEVNISPTSSQPFVDTFGALWLADYVAAFLTAGGKETYYFHYLPWRLSQECDATWGSFTMFSVDEASRVEQPLSQYFAARLLTQDWAQPGDEANQVFAASSDVVDSAGRQVVTAYPLQRPDGSWSVLLVNKDPSQPHAVKIVFRGAQGERSFSGDVAVATFGANEYAWHPNGAEGRAAPDGPIARTTRVADSSSVYVLPKASITVVRGAVR
jgi:hypothetical protein